MKCRSGLRSRGVRLGDLRVAAEPVGSRCSWGGAMVCAAASCAAGPRSPGPSRLGGGVRSHIPVPASAPRPAIEPSTARPCGCAAADVADSVGLTIVNSVEFSVGKLWDTFNLVRKRACWLRGSGGLPGGVRRGPGSPDGGARDQAGSGLGLLSRAAMCRMNWA
jgi:hypothetical protein